MAWIRKNGLAGGLAVCHVDFDGGHIDAVLAIATFIFCGRCFVLYSYLLRSE